MAETLLHKGIINYCPLNKVLKQWSDRRKIVLEPLFKGYVFIRIEETKKWDVKKIDGIINYVHWLGKPARVKESEIYTIKMFLQEFNDVEVINRQLDVITAVVFGQEVLINYRGIILEVSGSRARGEIVSMGIQLSAVFDKTNLEPAISDKY